MDIVEQIKGAVAGHEAEIAEGIEKVGDFVDEKTGGQYAAQVDQAQEFLKDQLGGAAQ
nr:antitoxin [Propionicimonas sp.]